MALAARLTWVRPLIDVAMVGRDPRIQLSQKMSFSPRCRGLKPKVSNRSGSQRQVVGVMRLRQVVEDKWNELYL